MQQQYCRYEAGGAKRQVVLWQCIREALAGPSSAERGKEEIHGPQL
jgi:hypothetical protein